MKHVNFINTLSPQQQYEIRRWWITSTIIITATMIIIICYFTPQLYALYAIKKEISYFKEKTKDYASTTNARNTLKKENELLQTKKTRINNYLLNPKNPHTYITTLTNACNKGIIIEQIRINKNDIELIILSPTTENAAALSQHMTDTGQFTNTKITSLQQHDPKNQFKCTIKGTIKK